MRKKPLIPDGEVRQRGGMCGFGRRDEVEVLRKEVKELRGEIEALRRGQ